MAFEKSQWIWSNCTFTENEYAEFYDTLEFNGGKVLINVSVCGDYTLFVNGKYAGSNQYGDFEHYKVYDSIDITDKLKKGENRICILVWYFGFSSMRYFLKKPGLIYEVMCDGKVVLSSSEKTLSRKSVSYESGEHIHKISPQLSYSFKYNSLKEDNWLSGANDGFSDSVIIQDKKDFYIRPIKRHELKPIVKGEVSKNGDRYIIDLGEEYVGLCSFSINSEKEQNINVAYGELLLDGHVKKIIRNRNFSFDYVARAGKNVYTNYMLRLACRYIEIECEHPIDIEYVGIIPQAYDVKEAPMPKLGALDSRIYDICVNTLKLCMMEHYVDCPWREQCLYAFDSRNQMLSGYYAFADKNTEYARANLLLMSKDFREDRLLSICSPCGENLVIPSFSFYYIVAVKEYLEYSGDLSLGEEVFEKVEDLLGAFADGMREGMFTKFAGSDHWNFYDWAEYLSGKLHQDDDNSIDFMINCIGVYALKAFDFICEKLGRVNKFSGLADEIIKNARERFFNKETETFFVADINEKPTELANSFAILSGIADEALKEKLAKRLADNEFLTCSFSMKCFKYDALLSVDEGYKDVILEEIRVAYKKMLDAGSTTVWETAKGPGDFDHAGSLCHGWSAIPIYYYHKFLGKGE